MQEGDRITFEGEGEEAVDTQPGDLVFVLRQKPHPVFKRAGAVPDCLCMLPTLCVCVCVCKCCQVGVLPVQAPASCQWSASLTWNWQSQHPCYSMLSGCDTLVFMCESTATS